MKLILIASLALLLTACGTNGEPKLLAAYFDSQDTCQRANWPNGSMPRYCGSGQAGRTTIYATPRNQPIGQAVGYTKNQ